MLFLADTGVPRTVDGHARMTTATAVLCDLALLSVFAVQHSVMARRRFKSRLRRRVPASLERTGYVLATDLVLALVLVCWQPFGGVVWRVEGPGAAVLWTLYAAGWLLAYTATFAVDHYQLMGLRQAGWCAQSAGSSTLDLRVTGLHRVVRHPLMTGLLVAFWATPHMGASHLLFAATASVYIAVGIRCEERDLRRDFGAHYDEYAARVPAVLPRVVGLTGRERR